ncbi:uncharacterized protein LOC126797630 isoform X2 [Argentina anserina]|uniref:uncharacterized protein LOC126797630 isoform X2 n=1 Tax=Argentina anserina TaxID=57926 RepID=UPI0021762138|nr:uncharacterized protein LOC126797630 isoform X2 [Potentilla anserina]
MVSGSRIEGGNQIISAGVRETIQSIKEIVGNHSDIDIYWALKEADMDPNETAQKLLNQDPFHEVKRKRDKKKEVPPKSIVQKVLAEPRRQFESAGQGPRSNTTSERVVEPKRHIESAGQGPRSNAISDHNIESRRHFNSAGQGPKFKKFSDRNAEPRRHFETAGQGPRHNSSSDRNVRRGGYVRRGFSGVSREFRVVRDNRANNNSDGEIKPASPQCTTSTNEQVISTISEKGQTGSSSSQRPSNRQHVSQALNGQIDSRIRFSDANSTGNIRKESSMEKRVPFSNSASRVQAGKPNNSQPHSASSTSVIGVYSSSTDPVHVPSPDSRPSASVGAIKREVGVVGVRKQSSDNSKSAVLSSSFSNSLLGKEGSTESFRSFTGISKPDQLSQTSESVMPSIPVNRSFISNQHNVRPHQQPMGHQKGSQPNKEWKPKSSQKPSSNSPGVIGTPTKSASPPSDASKVSESEDKLQDKLARVNIYENCNVVIAQNIRVPESDRFQLTFGSLGTEFDSMGNTVNEFQAGPTDELNREPPASLSASAPESHSDEASSTKPVDLLDDQVRNSGSDFSAPSAVPEHLPEKRETSSPQSLDNYAEIGLVRNNSPSFAPSESQHQDPPELQGFTAFDPQTGYDIPYYRPSMDESVRGQGLPSPQEALNSHNANSHNANSIPASTVSMLQQQPPHVAQMYPQVHVSHYPMPFRQFISPVYVPPMAVPGYSNNPAYPHMSNGNSYVLMPGGGSHLNASSLKYGVQQFKPVPAGSPTGFGNFTTAGYAMNAPGVVGGATGLEDSSRMKYKDGNLYVPNPQAETSEIWIQNQREHPAMQSAPYYNMPGQSPHAAYMPSHAGHASFNAAAAQSSHMQFPGMYHPPQPAAMASPHHMGPAMPGNVGVGVAAAAPGAQAYQQPQLNHMNWTTNF